MRAGLFLAYWPWFSPEEQVELAVLADELGLDSVWVSEAWGQDAVSVLGLLAGKTERIALGSGLMQIPARQPTATAMAAATLDVLIAAAASGSASASRARRSPRAGTACRSRGPLRAHARVRRDRARGAGPRGPLEYEGERVPLPLPDGLGKPLKLLAKPVQERIPIYLGAIGPKAVEQVGEIADGWLPFMLDPRARRRRCSTRCDARPRAGRAARRADIDIAAVVPRWRSTTTSTRRATPCARGWPSTSGRWARKEKNFYVELAERAGHGDAAREVPGARCSPATARAPPAALTDELIDAMALATTPDGLDDRLAAYEARRRRTRWSPSRAGRPRRRSCARSRRRCR